MIFYQQKQNGFSLVETLVAISILLIVIVGPMTISMQSAKSASFASEQVQAFFLAQEGLEIAQKIRDDLLLESELFEGNSTPTYPSWADFSTNSGVYEDCLEDTGCGLSWSSSNANDLVIPPIDCATASCLLYQSDASRARFSHESTGTETLFTRRIYFEDVVDDTKVRVRSVVTWRTGSLLAEQKVEVDTYLYNIYDTP